MTNFMNIETNEDGRVTKMALNSTLDSVQNVSMKLLMSSHFEKLFKQGKINEIRVGYFVAAIIISFLSAKSVVTITEVIYNILTK